MNQETSFVGDKVSEHLHKGDMFYKSTERKGKVCRVQNTDRKSKQIELTACRLSQYSNTGTTELRWGKPWYWTLQGKDTENH